MGRSSLNPLDIFRGPCSRHGCPQHRGAPSRRDVLGVIGTVVLGACVLLVWVLMIVEAVR